MKNYRLLIQYEGTRYDGWQRQKNTDNTIQGKIEAVLSKRVGKPVQISGASRTDAGVHARGQVANVKLEFEVNELVLKDYLNKYLPEDIEIADIKICSNRFHSRLNSGNKTYTYRISTDKGKHIFIRKYVYELGNKLDITKMKEAANYLIGEHDFQGFCSKKMKKSSVRKLEKIDFVEKGGILKITYVGSGFLYHMVRVLTGTLIEVGLGTRNPKSIIEILEKKERSLAGYLAPAKGLCLEKVNYQ